MRDEAIFIRRIFIGIGILLVLGGLIFDHDSPILGGMDEGANPSKCCFHQEYGWDSWELSAG